MYGGLFKVEPLFVTYTIVNFIQKFIQSNSLIQKNALEFMLYVNFESTCIFINIFQID